MKLNVLPAVQEYLIECIWTRGSKPEMVVHDEFSVYQEPIILTGKTLKEVWGKFKNLLKDIQEINFTQQDFNTLTIKRDIIINGGKYETKYYLIPKSNNKN